jgi:hypothetical protein
MAEKRCIRLTSLNPTLSITGDSTSYLVMSTFTFKSTSEAETITTIRSVKSCHSTLQEYSQSQDRVQVRVIHLGRNVGVPLGQRMRVYTGNPDQSGRVRSKWPIPCSLHSGKIEALMTTLKKATKHMNEPSGPPCSKERTHFRAAISLGNLELQEFPSVCHR